MRIEIVPSAYVSLKQHKMLCTIIILCIYVVLAYSSLNGGIGEGVERGDTRFRVGGLMRETIEDGIGE